MAKPIAIAILANGRRASREFETLGSKAAKWGKRVAAAGAVAAVALAKTVVSAASDAQQSIGATEQIYGKYADTVIKRSNQAANAIGLSANEYRELSNVTGAMLKSSGMPLAKVADLTDKLNRRAADMAATFGGTTREAVEAVSSLLRGEADPIERYGVSIKQSDVNARLAAKGLDKLEGSAKKTAEQQARLDLLFGQSKDSAGQFARESNTLAGQQQRLAAKIENTKAKVGAVLLPAVTKLVGYANKHLVPALEDGAKWLERNSDEIAAFGKGIGRHALPPLKTLGELAGKTAKWLAELPAPVKEVGVQAGIAALILPRLTAAAAAAGGAFTVSTAKTKQFYAELTYAETRAQRTSAVLGKLGGAAKAAAGVGGMVLLAQGTEDAGTAMGALQTAAGGAALGFSLGGPWGAAVGVVGGVGKALWDTKKANDEAKRASQGFTQAQLDAMAPQRDYKDTLDETTGALTKLTRSRAHDYLAESGALATANQYSISTRDLTGAALGRAGAEERLHKQVRRAIKQNPENIAGIIAMAGAAGLSAQEIEKERGAIKARTDDTKTWKQALKGVPPEVATRLKQLDFKPNLKQINTLSERYKLTPKQVTTILKATGRSGVVKEVGGVTKVLKDAGKVKVIDSFNPSLSSLLGVGERNSKKANKNVKDSLKNSTKTTVDSATLTRSLSGLLGVARTDARAGASGIGVDLKTGLPAGFAGADALWAVQVASAVRHAIAAGRRAAQAKSPSRKTMALGRDLADGLVVGMSARKGKVKSAAQKLLGNALAGVGGGSKGIDKALDKVTKKIQKRITGKNETKREKRILQNLRDEYKALTKNGKAQDKINAKLKTAQQNLGALKQAAKDAAAAVLASVRAYGSITSLEEGHLNNPAALVAQQKARVENAERYAELITQLTGKLNKTSLQELIDKGVEGGLAAAEALAAGGQSTIDQVNALQKRLDKVGTDLGKTTVTQFHQAGIDSAQGLVNGLLAKEKALDKAAKKLAKKLVKAVKKELGINSPSRVGKDLGKNFAGSVDLGTNVVPLDRTGRLMARDLVKGFGEPTMTARAAWEATQAAAAAQQPIKVAFTLTAQQMSALQRGKEIQMDLDVYHGNGGRSRAS